ITAGSPLSLHDALPIYSIPSDRVSVLLEKAEQVLAERLAVCGYSTALHVQTQFTEAVVELAREVPIVVLKGASGSGKSWHSYARSEEHTSELQSRENLV